MKIKSLFAILLALILLVCTCVLPVSAKNETNNNDVQIIINDEVSAETKEKIEKYFATGEPATDNGTATTYGLTCTLLGHKLENTAVSTITHKVRSTAPRCVKKTYAYQACTRCDYETSQLVETVYIYCCA
jgi:hypothetical protein